MPASTRRRAGRPASRRPNIIRHFVNDGSMFGGETLSDLYYEQWIPANELVGEALTPPTAGTRQATTLQAAHYDYMQWVDNASSAMTLFQFPVPVDIDTSTDVHFQIFWETPTAASFETAVWRLAQEGIGDGEDIEIGPSPEDEVTDNTTASGANYLRRTSAGTIAAADLPTANDLWCFEFFRRGGDNDDDLTDVANVIGLAIQYKALGSSNAQWS